MPFSASTVNLYGASNTNMFRNDLRVTLSSLKSSLYVNIQFRSNDLGCILAFLSAIPRGSTVGKHLLP